MYRPGPEVRYIAKGIALVTHLYIMKKFMKKVLKGAKVKSDQFPTAIGKQGLSDLCLFPAYIAENSIADFKVCVSLIEIKFTDCEICRLILDSQQGER